MRTNRLAAWLNDNTIYRPGERSNIGKAIDLSDGNNVNKWLYLDYVKYLAEDSNSNKPLSVMKFSESLHVLLTETLKLTECYRRDKGRHGRQFAGLVLREPGGIGPSPIDFAFNIL